MSRSCTLALVALAACAAPLVAAPPWQFIPFKRVEAKANQSYELAEKHGPWMILAMSFAGETAEQQAQALVLELRQKFKLEAFTHRQHYDYTDPVQGLGLNRYGGPKRMRHANNVEFDEIAVLVGHFDAVDHPEVERTLQKLKHAWPDCLDPKKNKSTSQPFANTRLAFRFVSQDPAKKTRGPMGSAFVTRNPLLPPEFFAPKGLDPFLVDLNEGVEFGLLKCPQKYTVKVATFRGIDTMNTAVFERLTTQSRKLSKIDEAALKADKLVHHLRQQGVEAYQFHDRTESIVTVGAFDSVGQPRQDGKIEINPAVHRIIQQYGPQQQAAPGQAAARLEPRVMAGVVLDYQPLPIEVPRQSIAAAYARDSARLR